MASFLAAVQELTHNLGASADECRNKRLHLLNARVAEFKDVDGLTMRHNMPSPYKNVLIFTNNGKR